MCSGVLFLDRTDGLSVQHIWKRNIPHILLALFVWATVYKLIPRFLHEQVTADALRAILLELLCGCLLYTSPILDSGKPAAGDTVITTGDGKGVMIRYTFTA